MTMFSLWSYFRDHPPSLLLGTCEFLIGAIFFVWLFHKISSNLEGLKINGLTVSRSDSVSLGCKIISALFAINTCASGLVILRDCGCISLKVSHHAVKHYMCFGLSYFIYDIYAMFVVYKVAGEEKNPEYAGIFKTFGCFIRSRFLLVAHHLLLPFFIFPIFMGGLKSFGGGDCLVAAGFLLESSTPFVSLRKILATLNMKKSVWYIVNGAVMTIVFFFCRVVFFPLVYYLYSIEHGASLLETITQHVPLICSISMLVLFLPQIYWFGIMVRGGLKVISGKDSKED